MVAGGGTRLCHDPGVEGPLLPLKGAAGKIIALLQAPETCHEPQKASYTPCGSGTMTTCLVDLPFTPPSMYAGWQ